MFVYSPPFTIIHLLNLAVQLSFDYALVKSCDSFQPLFYLLLSSFLAGSLHPVAGHFIAEHYIFENVKNGATESIAEVRAGSASSGAGTGDGEDEYKQEIPPPETYSYYGPLNILTYNVGLHNEHHDFPAVPWTKLPVLHRIAAEFYETLPCHRSWSWVIWTFIMDRNVGMWCRVKRAQGGRVVGGAKGNGRGGEGISATSSKSEEDAEGDGWKESEIQN